MRRAYPSSPYNQQQGHYSTPGVNSNMSMSKAQEMLEEENDQLVDSLKHKVSALKSLSIDIGDEVRGQNRLLNDMGKDFDTTGGLLSGTMKRLHGLSQGGHNRWMCYMIVLIVFVFIVLYFIIKWRH
ncbi:PREDICTED: BET1 homolog [Amphimedon queenslandica]|uniref:BET1 homolog n=1 Tax=Amphimedon queenslandica TaxID=400682 RepID=A0AAN0I8E0_AMPQE|nr:PREDICTED: BET1 homolog [Amphimedon queenslandica]|eukprot:XP_003382429.1 PREDICTED: BET1 homolog [Amphimedon queenslandica]